MLKAYFDDSGTDGRSPYYLLAGYLSTVEKWERFSDEWQMALDVEPRLKYFKIKEAFRLKDQFYGERGWTRTQANDRIRMFRSIVRRHTLGGFAVAMPQALYDVNIKNKIPKELDLPTTIASWAVLNSW